MKFQLGLFDDSFVDEEAAFALVGNEAFRAAGHRAQAESVTLLQVAEGALPLAPATRLYADGCSLPDAVASPEEADIAVVRVNAPWEPRDDLFLEAWFHQGSLDFPPAEVERIRALAARVTVVLVVNLDRAAILTPFVDMPGVVALVGVFGTSDEALRDALSGRIPPRGRLPLESAVLNGGGGGARTGRRGRITERAFPDRARADAVAGPRAGRAAGAVV